MELVKVGDEVRITPRRSSKYDTTPEGGYAGTVIKVARKYATAAFVLAYESGGQQRRMDKTVEFDISTGIERGAFNQQGYLVRTPEQIERDNRESAAHAVLRDRGIEFRLGRSRSFSLELLEALAEVVRTFESEADQ
jgi:hypothetical protein